MSKRALVRKGLLAITLLSIGSFLVLVALPLTAFTQPAPPRELTIPIGVIQPLTGPGAAWGTSCLRGAEMAVEEVNKKGVGVKGTTYKFKIIAEDDKYFADTAVDRVKKLIERDRVGVVYGSLGSASSLAEAPICAANKVLHFFDGFDTNVIAAANAYSFMLAVNPLSSAQGYIEFLAQNVPDIRTALLLYVNDATGQAAVRAYGAEAKKRGWTVPTETYERGAVEFAPLCVKVIGAKPQLVFLMAVPPGDAHKVCKGLRELGYKGPIAQAGAFIMEDLSKMLGNDIGPVYHLSGIGEKPYTNDSYIAFYNEFLKKYGKGVWTTKELQGYSWVKMYAQAIETAQTLESSVIRNLLATPGKEWFHLSGGGKSYCITEQIAKEMGVGSNRLFNVVWQLATWDNVAKKEVNAGWVYPHGWPGGKLPK